MGLLRFDGRVALVTGAGGGLGRVYALLLASRGASVVVNDLGGDAKGGGRSSKAADDTVQMIRTRGGKAVANYDSVEEGHKLVKTAVDAFGRVDIVINNAGILRDRSFSRISDEDWDLIHRVHLRGSFLVTRAAFPYMKKQGYGRIIMTSSPSGIYGNFGQANYSAAKLGLVGLSNTIAIEGRKYNIQCNTIAPTAYSRLTKDLFPPEAEELLKAEHVAPVVAYLCHESCEDNGGLFETAGGWIGKVRWQKAEGALARVKGKEFSIEDVRDNWSQVCDMTKPVYHASTPEVTASLMEAAMQIESGANAPSPMEGATQAGLEGAKGNKQDFAPFQLTHRDLILYALGVGASLTKSDKRDLKYLYEMHPEFSALPTFAVIPPQQCMQDMFVEGKLGDFHPANVLHGEQFLEVYKPFPTSGSVTCHSEVVEVLDKGSGAVLVINVTIKDEKKEPVCMNQYVTFIVGAGRFGGKKNSPVVKPLAKRPSGPPDVSMKNKTGESQAALYRLSGDYNPLHIDPDFAAVGGFSEPILHGLVSFGIAARNVLRHYAGDDVTKFKAIKARFAKPVMPGQTIQTDMWRKGNRIHFECKVVENGQAVLTGAYVDLTDVVVGLPSAGPVPQPAGEPQKVGGGEVQSDVLFEEMAKLVASSPDLVQKVKAVYLWNITDGKGKTLSQWTADLKTPPGAIYRGPPKDGIKPGCTLTISDEDFISIAAGNLTAQKAFFAKKLQISGNIMLSQKLEVLFKKQSKL